jgi:hypothetical protein
MIFLFFNPLVLALMNMTPENKEEAENIKKDPLLDIPLTSDMAKEIAKDLAGGNREPEQFTLVIYKEGEKSVPAWNFSFKDKEVLIDATSGELIYVKTKEVFTPLGFVGNPIFIIFTVLISSFIIVYLFKVLMDKYFKKETIPIFYEEEKI